MPERSKHRKTFRIKLLMWGRTGKDIDSGLFFALNGILEKWKVVPSKSLKSTWIFFSKKGYKPCSILFSKITSSKSLCKEIQKSLFTVELQNCRLCKEMYTKCNFCILYFCLNQICHWFWWHGCRIKQEKNDSTCCVPGALQGQCGEDSWLAINHHFIMELDSHRDKNG